MVTLQTEIVEKLSQITVWAVGWNEPGRGKKPVKCFVSSCGLNAATQVYEKRKWRTLPGQVLVEKYVKKIPCCQMILNYFAGSGAVDQHNQLRQGELALERNFETNNWTFRWFCTIVGLLVTNAFSADSTSRSQKIVNL